MRRFYQRLELDDGQFIPGQGRLKEGVNKFPNFR